MVDATEDVVVAKVVKRVIPIAMLLFFISLIDRANISYAALQMNKDLALSPSIYGFAAGVFFVGYFLFEVPSNMVLVRVGARLWLGRIMITWGIIATLMAWVSGPDTLYVVRFLLGAAEAGLLPGLLYYLTLWIPGGARGATFSVLMATTAIAYIIGGPLAAAILSLDGLFGLKGWQLLFVIEGVPAAIVGIVVLLRLPDRPEDATWLSRSEKDVLRGAIEREQRAKAELGLTSWRQGLLDPRVLIAALFTFFMICDNFGTVFWLPQIIKSFGDLSDMQVGVLSAVPFCFAGVGMVVCGRHSDRTGDRKWHLIGGALVAMAGYACAGLAPQPVLSFIAICIAAMGVWSMFGVILAYSGDLLGGVAAASGFAVINSVGTLGGFAGPFLVGFVRQQTQSFSGGLLVLAGFGLITALTGLLLQDSRRTRRVLAATEAATGG